MLYVRLSLIFTAVSIRNPLPSLGGFVQSDVCWHFTGRRICYCLVERGHVIVHTWNPRYDKTFVGVDCVSEHLRCFCCSLVRSFSLIGRAFLPCRPTDRQV